MARLPPTHARCTFAAAWTGLLLIGLEPVHAAASPVGGSQEAGMMDEAKGRFDIELKPASASGAAVTRMTLDKRFHGDVDGTGAGEMLSYGSPATGNAGYVAIERVTGTVKGRTGGFALLHSGVLEGGRPTSTITVVPGSGTGELTGIVGAMTIDPSAGHAYVLRYSLPTASPAR